MKQFGGKQKIAFACACAVALTAGAETTTLDGETKSISSQYTTTGVTFTGASSEIVAPVGVNSGTPNAKPTSEFADFYGVSLLSPEGTLPGIIDASALTDDAVGKISTGLSDLVFDTVDSCVSGARAVDLTTYLKGSSSDPVIYWKNRKLSDIKMVTAITQNGSREAIARTCFFKNDGQTATMQFQRRMGNETADKRRRYLIVTGVELKQEGDNITAHVNMGGYVNTEQLVAPYVGECIDFSQINLSDKTLPVEHGDSYYAVRCLLAGEESTDGGKGIEVKTAGFETVCATDVEFSTANKDPVVYWKNLKLDDIVSMQADVSAASAWKTAYGFFMDRKDADTLHVTFQRFAGDYNHGYDYVVSTTLEFKQDGENVTARGIDSGYRYLQIEHDTHTPAVGAIPLPVSALNSSRYPTRNIVVSVRPKADFGGPVDVAGGVRLSGSGMLKISAPASGFSAITGDGGVWYASDLTWTPPLSNTLYGVTANSYNGLTVFDGGYHVISKTGAIPANGTVILKNHATVVAKSADSVHLCDGGKVYVYPDCTLQLDKSWGFGNLGEVKILGGCLRVNVNHYYANELTLADGAIVDGITDDGFRFGNDPNYPWIYSTGSQTNWIKCGIRLYRPENSSGYYSTFFTSADLILAGRILKSGGDVGYEGALVKKRGAGKLILAPTCFNPDTVYANTARVEVVEGTLRNESPNALRIVNSVELHCGTTYEAVKEAQTIGALVVDAKRDWESDSATLKFENGGSLSLPEGGLAIAAGGLLVLDGDVAETSFRVGTTACLSPKILSRIRIRKNGRNGRVYQNDDGTIFGPGGCVVIIR